MKTKKYKIIVLILSLAAILSSCQKNGDSAATQQPVLTNTPTQLDEVISDSLITFVFSQDAENNHISLYHQLAYVKMESAGYNIKNVYANDYEDISSTLSNLEQNGTEYVIVASASHTKQTDEYKQNSNSNITFIQYGDYYSNTIFTYREKLYEYYYLCGVALCSESTSKIAGFIADNHDEKTIRCINAFALGMKSVDENAIVMVSWAENATDENQIAQALGTLSYQSCDVFAYFMQGDVIEQVADNLGAAYMTMSTHTMINTKDNLTIKPVIELDKYYTSIINSNKQPMSNEFGYLGMAEGIVSYQLSDNISSATSELVNTAYQNIAHGYNVFSGPIYNELGLVVPDDTELPEGDVLDMLWFVDNVIGELPAG